MCCTLVLTSLLPTMLSGKRGPGRDATLSHTMLQCEHDMQKIENVVSSHIDTDVDVHRYMLVLHSIHICIFTFVRLSMYLYIIHVYTYTMDIDALCTHHVPLLFYIST